MDERIEQLLTMDLNAELESANHPRQWLGDLRIELEAFLESTQAQIDIKSAHKAEKDAQVEALGNQAEEYELQAGEALQGGLEIEALDLMERRGQQLSQAQHAKHEGRAADSQRRKLRDRCARLQSKLEEIDELLEAHGEP